MANTTGMKFGGRQEGTPNRLSKELRTILNNILFNYRLHDNQESAELIVSMEKYQEMHAFLVTINSYTDAKMKRKMLRYKYFIFTIIFDVMSDVVHMRIMQGIGKIKFCIKLFGKNKQKI